MYTLAVDRSVLRELGNAKRYTAKIYRQITLKILKLALDPRPTDCKAIGPGYRVDSGEYRIYYEVNDRDRTVIVWLVGKRNDDEVYRRLQRKLGN